MRNTPSSICLIHHSNRCARLLKTTTLKLFIVSKKGSTLYLGESCLCG